MPGRHLCGPPLPRETAQFLRDSGWAVLAGNHERQILDDEHVLDTVQHGRLRVATADETARPHDHRAMAALVRRHGRPDWQRALLGGYVSRRPPA